MKKKEHRPGVLEAHLVKRHLKLERASLEKIQSAVEEIDKLFGMDSISFDEKSRTLNMEYDATLLCRGPAGKSVEFSHFAHITLKYRDIFLHQPITIPEVV